MLLAFVYMLKLNKNSRIGIQVTNPPNQHLLDNHVNFSYKNMNFTKVAKYDITGLLLSKKRYWFDSISYFSRYDFALGWGPMSDARVINKLNIWQDRRWYR